MKIHILQISLFDELSIYHKQFDQIQRYFIWLETRMTVCYDRIYAMYRFKQL